VLELLIHENWNNSDGLGALILSPTRELVRGPALSMRNGFDHF